ncbi:Major facilitator superfamily [Trinorchestia longiramus]|nr:Major facilitator superfamily [Trinorchestia longiramus]
MESSLMGDRRLTVREITKDFALPILRDDLNIRRVASIDNTPSHKLQLIRAFLTKHGISVIRQSPYSGYDNPEHDGRVEHHSKRDVPGVFSALKGTAFVSCGLGVHMVGYVMICYGLCDALCSVCFSPMVKLVGRVPVFVLGATANVSMIILFFIWQPNSDEMYVFFIAAAVWGIADAVWQTQINAFYGVIFPGEAEAAFSNYRMWESVGFIITFVTNSTICIDSKLYIVIGFLSVGMLGYFTIELLEKYRVLPRGPDDKVLRLYDH